MSRWAADQGALATGIDLNPEQVAVANDLAAEAGLGSAQFRVGSVYHPHHLIGEHKGFWNWTLSTVALGLVSEGVLSTQRLDALVAGMNAADASPDTVVAHCRMHQLIARKPA